jgi:hypothetical protein
MTTDTAQSSVGSRSTFVTVLSRILIVVGGLWTVVAVLRFLGLKAQTSVMDSPVARLRATGVGRSPL